MKENLGALPHPKIVSHDSTPHLQLSISRVTKDHTGHGKSLTFLFCFTDRFLFAVSAYSSPRNCAGLSRRTTLKELTQNITGLTALY